MASYSTIFIFGGEGSLLNPCNSPAYEYEFLQSSFIHSISAKYMVLGVLEKHDCEMISDMMIL